MAKSGFGKFIGELAGNASKKSGALVESARLNNEVNHLLHEIEDLQFELGCAYYEDHKQKSTGPYIEIIQKINHKQAEIHSRNAKLLAYKGMQYCAGCGTVVANDDEFCSKCGTPVPRGDITETGDCPNCGETLKQGERYCQKCGLLLERLRKEE